MKQEIPNIYDSAKLIFLAICYAIVLMLIGKIYDL
jgi:hypothetical protein